MAKRKAAIVEMVDPIMHTIGHPICGREGCICADLEYEQLIADQQRKPKRHHTVLVERRNEASLNPVNRGFSLMR